MRALFAMLDSVAPTPLPVLILGETGVGKEVIAAEVHRRSQRASRPYLQLNCAALPESILEGELFGYERGAFTGAHAAKAGLFESADGGTVFLDELGEMPLSIQAKLLRVLESGDVTRLGALRSKHIDVRFIGATNRQLAQEVRRGAFRADLYYRINGLSITVPPLRKRPADILPLAELFLSRFAAKLGRVCPSLDGSAKDALLKADYPGNVRQLRNVVERAAVVSGGAVIRVEHLDWGDDGADPHPSSSAVAPSALITQAGDMMGDHTVSMPAHAPASARSGAAAGSAHGALSTVDPRSERLTDELKNIERDRIVRALEAAAGNQSEAARILGISRYVLIARIREFGLARPRAGRKNP
jgi:transcriptional regulator with GAF, ATPase, and Fis domain